MRRLSFLFVSQAPPSPPRFGAQVRMHGLMTALSERHDVSVVSYAEPELLDEARRALGAYCREVELVVDRVSASTARKRLLQLRSIASARAFEELVFTSAALQGRVDALLARARFDAICLEGPFVARHRFHPAGGPRPRLVLGEHNVEYDVRRQFAGGRGGLARRAFLLLDGWKVRRAEQALWGRVDAVTVPSREDAARVRSARPGARVAIVPNGVDVDRVRPRPDDPVPDGGTLLFFGALDYPPNVDGLLFFLDEIWPRVASTHPSARVRILGRRPPPALLARQGPRVELAGFIEDLRPSLAAAMAVIVPLRLGGGTRLKILEAMAMARPVVSTTLGAEGIGATSGRELLLADDPARFAAELRRLLDDPALGARLGSAARALVEARYAWRDSARVLERLVLDLRGAVTARGRPSILHGARAGGRPPAAPAPEDHR
jgi:glycosyltransferase involved in cell wall biosynthesis